MCFNQTQRQEAEILFEKAFAYKVLSFIRCFSIFSKFLGLSCYLKQKQNLPSNWR